MYAVAFGESMLSDRLRLGQRPRYILEKTGCLSQTHLN